jgi:hypothetical protein
MSLTVLQKELGNLEWEIRTLQPDAQFYHNRKELVDKLEYIKCLASRYTHTGFGEVLEVCDNEGVA